MSFKSAQKVPQGRRTFHTSTTLAGAVMVAALTQVSSFAHAQGQPTTGWYVGGAAGANLEEDNRFRNGGANANDSYGAGYVGTLNLGYGFGNNWRVEGEPGYRNNQVDKVNGANGSGRTQMATMMFNALYDFNQVKTPLLPLTPHIGAGVGYAHVWNRSTQNGVGVSGGDDVPAFQAIAGLDYSITPNEKVGLDYRYLVAHDAVFPVNNGLQTRAGDLNNHSFLVTYRFEFNTPSAPPPVAIPVAAASPPPRPAPVASVPENRPYEVYFDFDSATLTSDAKAIVQVAAQNAKQSQVTRILATGHTDTVGTGSYNIALSKRRAAAVKAELVRDGISARDISTNGVGEEGLAVSTGEGVNEPRNRRVEIVIQTPGA
jgi:outer membrane protein OmpA-like peptidoglycan-associated protein